MRYRCEWGEDMYQIDLERYGEQFQAHIGGKTYQVEVLDSSPGQITVSFAGRPLTIFWAADGHNKWVALEGCAYLLERPSAGRNRRKGEQAAENTARAPMPAQVRAVYTADNKPVEKGETLLLLEAMKMEIRVQAPRAGVVRKVLVSTGETVNRDQVLVEIGD
jgi:biotin carboxyl carrier protein